MPASWAQLGALSFTFHRLQPWGVGGCRGEDREEGLGTGKALERVLENVQVENRGTTRTGAHPGTRAHL